MSHVLEPRSMVTIIYYIVSTYIIYSYMIYIYIWSMYIVYIYVETYLYRVYGVYFDVL